MATDRTAQFLAELAIRLDAAAASATKQWWERYLKGRAAFRGVKMADTRRTVNALVAEFCLDDLSMDARLDLFAACAAQPMSEDKIAGTLLLAEHWLGELTLDHIERLAAPLAKGHLADWNSCDWYCIKVLGPFVDRSDEFERRARAIAGWRSAAGLWQRRAAAVSFVYLCGRAPEPFAGFRDLLVTVCESNAADATRWSHTSVGWLLRELSKVDRPMVEAFLAAHPDLSTEARKNATKYF